MPALDRAQILGTRDVRIARVAVPEWAENGVNEVCVRNFSAAQRAIIVQNFSKLGSTYSGEFLSLVCVASMCDEDGQLLCSPADAAAIVQRDGAAVERIAWAALRLNKLTQSAEEDLEKNSPPAPSGDSPSA